METDNQEKEEKKRHLKVMSLLKDDEDDCSAFTSDSTCNALPNKCSWCEAGAVADKCHSIANAMTLPSAVFKCSNLNEEVKKPIQEPVPTSFLKAVPEETCSTYDSEDSCNAGDCSWCKAGAVADKCHSIENGKRLPPAVFQCSNIDEEVEEEIEGPDDEEMCSTFTDDDDCNAQSDKCSWCKAGAVADKCHSIENAMRLPAAVFACSNLPSARDMFLLRAERMIEESEAMF